MLIRTLLFAPADSARKVRRLSTLPADVGVLDLEDAVAETAKAQARRGAAAAISSGRGLARIAVRVNGIRTPYFEEDLEATTIDGLELIVVPKVEHPDDLDAVDDRLSMHERRRGLTRPVRVIALLETAQGIANAERIAAEAPERFERFAFGAVDYRADTGVGASAEEFELLYARSRVVNAAAIARRGPAIDGPYLAIDDHEGLRARCAASRALGFGGRWSCTPVRWEL